MDDDKPCSSSEAEPLIGSRKPFRRHQSFCVYVALIAISILAITLVISFVIPSNDYLDPDVRDRIRREWNIELRQHQKEVIERINTRHRWDLEDENRIRLREEWRTEREENERDMEERRRREEQERIVLHEKWGKEVEEHERDMEERRRREEQERIVLREKWGKEVEEHEREAEERRRHEEEERLRLNMFWTDVTSHACTTYATREYTARLVNVPSYYNRRVEACMATPVMIHGAEYTPKWCEDHVGVPTFLGSTSS
jgi:hypothetical protein